MSADKAVEFGTDQATGLAEPSAPSSPNTLEYTIRRGDTWWGLADRFYGDGARAEELLEANIGRPQNDGRQITRRGFIYPGWTVRIAGATTPPATLVPAVRAPVELPSITAIATPVATAAAPSSSPVVVEPAPATQPPETSAPVAAPISGALIEIGGIAAGLGVAVWLALKSRRRPPRTPGVPETDTELDEHAFSRAAPAAVLAARRDGGDDPHGIVLGELLAGELLHRAHEAGLREVQLVVVAAPHRLLTACSTVRGVLVTPGVKSTVRHGPLLGGGVALWRYGGGPPIIDSSWFQCAH